ncbi:MAG: hypothetical protein AB7Q42_21630 [Acidimicrobiia bacterium]
MTDHHDRSEALLDALRAALNTTDAVPAEVVAAAKAGFTWRTIDAELAELSYDSLLATELAGTRGSVDTRTLSFEFGPIGIEIEVEDDGRSRRLVGQVAPGVPESIEIHHVDGVEPLLTVPDQHGRFRFAAIERGPVRLLLRFAPANGPAMLLTEWVTI